VISEGGQSKHNNKSKNKTIDKDMHSNRQRYGVHEYHMEVYEVTGGVRAVNKGVC